MDLGIVGFFWLGGKKGGPCTKYQEAGPILALYWPYSALHPGPACPSLRTRYQVRTRYQISHVRYQTPETYFVVNSRSLKYSIQFSLPPPFLQRHKLPLSTHYGLSLAQGASGPTIVSNKCPHFNSIFIPVIIFNLNIIVASPFLICCLFIVWWMLVCVSGSVFWDPQPLWFNWFPPYRVGQHELLLY